MYIFYIDLPILLIAGNEFIYIVHAQIVGLRQIFICMTEREIRSA